MNTNQKTVAIDPSTTGDADSSVHAQIYFDKPNDRLVFVHREANEEFWDDAWRDQLTADVYKKAIPRRNLIISQTQRYLPTGSRVMEGGCGLARYSWFLHQLGYETIALDYAPETIAFLKEHAPETNPTIGDVRKLDMPDDSIDGYWSLGVIEHFYDGYDAIRDEARRVIRPGGYLFLTFPHMSPHRRTLARLGRFPTWTEDPKLMKSFYQFGLSKNQVAKNFTQHGFRLVASQHFNGFEGICRMLPSYNATLRRIKASRRRMTRLSMSLINRLSRYPMGHSALLVLQKQ